MGGEVKSLDEIKARALAATPGPWERSTQVVFGPTFRTIVYASVDTAEFIAHARTDIPRLVKALERCMEQRDKAWTEHYNHLRPSSEWTEISKVRKVSFAQDDEEIDRILNGEGE